MKKKVQPNTLLRALCPPIIWKIAAPRFSNLRKNARHWGKCFSTRGLNGGPSDGKEIYWDEEFSKTLETWGVGNAWKEIEMLMADREGRVLDIACGTGKQIEDLSKCSDIEIHGCDFSDLLIRKAIERGIDPNRLKVCDATNTGYENDWFDYAYSIGSLEHFSVDGLSQVIAEGRRIVKGTVFHQVPTSRSGRDEGWIQPLQSYHNNSVGWWLERFQAAYQRVDVITSLWEDDRSIGKWFVCRKRK